MATKVAAARHLTAWAAAMKDRGARCDLEAGMAKLYASEAAQEVAVAALRLHGTAGLLESFAVERHYRDTPLMIIGEGTNEIQRLVIARNLLERYGERFGALTARDGEPDERRQMVLAVRQVVDKEIMAVGPDADQERPRAESLRALASLGVFGALVPPDLGGLGLDLPTWAMIVEEIARGSTALAAILTAHVAAARTIARFGTPRQRERLLPAMTRAEIVATGAGGAAVAARREAGGWVLDGATPLLDNARDADRILVPARLPDGRPACFVVARDIAGVTRGEPPPSLGVRGAARGPLAFERARLDGDSLLGGVAGRGAEQTRAWRSLSRLGLAATAVGLAQAAFEAALRYSQQRSTFGKPICQHQAVQLKLADMATRITAARLLTERAAPDAGVGEDEEVAIGLARLEACATACEVTLDAMRIHGGYGYTKEFPVERYYRDAAVLMVGLDIAERERLDLARRLLERGPRRRPVMGVVPWR
jgi:alkylation response protein AidB-like acyl-CoA dehydrogenase